MWNNISFLLEKISNYDLSTIFDLEREGKDK
jgi:hypothetical protein